MSCNTQRYRITGVENILTNKEISVCSLCSNPVRDMLIWIYSRVGNVYTILGCKHFGNQPHEGVMRCDDSITMGILRHDVLVLWD